MIAPPPPVLDVTEPDPSLVKLTHVIYALHGVSLLVGILGAATVVGAFLLGWPSLIAVILNYVKRSEARGTWLDSHFRWQIRTFWYALLWIVVASLVSLPFMLVLIGFVTLWVAAIAIGLWVLYRVVKGWMRLSAHAPMYV